MTLESKVSSDALPVVGVGVAGAGALGGSTLVDPPKTEEPLPRQFGKYTLLRKLAAGGMAELFLALHRSVAGFEKLVVIKRILPQMNQDQQFIDMLLHEARIAATLSHPNIVQTFDVGQVDGTYFIAMEHIHGEDIRTIVRQMKKKSVNELPLEHALHIVVGLCAGIAYAHEKRDISGQLLGIVHRDISPQNIVVTFSGDVKVVDFGVAKSLHAGEESKGGQLKGKVPYMSPEQAAGEDIDWRSDIFAAGVILFELTTGKRLFKGANEYDTLKLICETEYPLPSDVAAGYPVQLERIVMKALARGRDGRYQSAREMQADLEAFIRHERLPVSAVTMTGWMQSLFEESLLQQKAALQDIKQLADRIAAEAPQEYAPASTGSHPGAQFDQSKTGAALPGAATSIAPPSKRSGAIWALVAAVTVAGAAAGLYLWKGQQPVADNNQQGSTAQAAPAPPPAEPRGAIKFESDPPGASIWINGDLRKEVTPATIENLPLGQDLSVKLSKEGFESHKEALKLERAGDTKAVTAKLKTGSVTVELDILPEPTVWIDEKPWKGDPKKITGLSADEEHKIVVAASGYVPKTFNFTGKQGETKKFKHVMPKQGDAPPPPDKPEKEPVASGGTGSIRVNARGSQCVNVSVNGASLGPTPVVASVPAGNVRVTCKREDGTSASQGAKVDAGGTAKVSF
ncbi:MAG: protein kinase [Polyangiaceae bacterium]|nr:protein kinase [Polyangiaceae bacterium]